MNARNYLYILPLNGAAAKWRADNKLRTKERLLKQDIPTTRLIAVFHDAREVRAYDWSTLSGDFVLKPARGYGGGGIVVVRGWKKGVGKRRDGSVITAAELETEILNIIDGAYSLDNLPDTAFLEERVVVSNMMRKLAAGGVPDIRIIVCNMVPIMAMLRLPTKHSGGKANLHQGALGIGIDIRTGITTKGIYFGASVPLIPETKTKVSGIKLPKWRHILEVATHAQSVSGLGFAGVDIVLDEGKGALVLEINARPGLQIQLANAASLRTRLERVADMRIPSIEYGVELGQQLFAEETLVALPSKPNVLRVIEKVTVFGKRKKLVVDAKIDTGAFRTAIDAKIVHELGLDALDQQVHVRSGSGHQTRHTVKVALRLKGRDIDTIASSNDRAHMRYPVIIGRRDLKGFLVDPSGEPEDSDDRTL